MLDKNKMLDDIKDFHEKFVLDYNGPARLLKYNIQNFRITCLKEEIKEYEDACKAGDLPEMFDALIDLVYFALGTAYMHGFPFQKGWNLVQAANMKKIRAQNNDESKRGSKWDVIKPLGWISPDLTDLIFGEYQ